MLFSATDVAVAAIDFLRKNVDDRVVDSPPSRGPWRSLMLSASPLQGSHRVSGRHRSSSSTPAPSRMPRWQLYKRCMDEVHV